MAATQESREEAHADAHADAPTQPKALDVLLNDIRHFLERTYPDAEYASLTVKLPGRVPMAVFPVIPRA
ncbi:hypothetical protein [Zavarzinella formosa]|uniref:hypothetical protein n=1 Tax=Zavarzinella formosa TaxID=360055 RepID=UPI0012FB765E|nr:hypothetical protein [Zavarzinella formosa]